MSNRATRTFTTEFKERAAQRMGAGESASALASELGVRRKLLYEWLKAYQQDGAAGLNRKPGPKPGSVRRKAEGEASVDPLVRAEARIAELERIIGRQQVDLDFFRRALRLTDADSPNSTAPASTRSSKR